MAKRVCLIVDPFRRLKIKTFQVSVEKAHYS